MKNYLIQETKNTPTKTTNTVAKQLPVPANKGDSKVLLASHESPSIPLADAEEVAPLPGQFISETLQEPEIIPIPQNPAIKKTPEPPPVAIEPPATSQAKIASPPAKNAVQGITLKVDNVDVSKALEMLGRQAKVSILVSPKVTGSVTLDIKDQTFDEALESIAKLCNLDVKKEKDAYYISTVDEARKAEESNMPVRVYHLNYVKSGDVIKIIKPLLSKKGIISQSPDSEMGISSDISTVDKGGTTGGTKEVKAGGNTWAGGEMLIVQDYEYVLKKLDRLIAEFDVQPLQVLIEAVIVQVTLTKDMECGINFAALDGAGKVLGVGGDGSLINAAAGFTPASVITTTGAAAGKLSNGFAVADRSSLKIGWSHGNTTAFIEALESFGETKILATPRLTVLNKQRAEVHLGKNIGYQDQTITQTSNTASTNFLKVGTQLRLRPFVTPDGMIRMEVHPERSDGSLDENSIPQTVIQQVTTNVLIPDGKTIIIGGLLSDNIDVKWEGIPLVSRLPYVGFLFRYTVETTKKEELVVILTPHILSHECPEQINFLGKPQTLELKDRVSQRPRQEVRDGSTLFELMRPENCPTVQPIPEESVGIGSRNSANVKKR